MKKLFTITLLLLASLSQVIFAQEVIKLDTPSAKKGMSIMETLAKRHSISTFQDKELNTQDLSDLLWAANGINRAENGKRTASSAQNSQDIDIYVALKTGVYLYNANMHILNLIVKGDYRNLANDKVLPPCLLFLVANTSKYRNGNNPIHISEMNRIDAGIISQNISLFCTGVGLGTRPRAQMNQKKLREILKLSNEESLLLNHPVGYPK